MTDSAASIIILQNHDFVESVTEKSIALPSMVNPLIVIEGCLSAVYRLD